MIFGKISFQKKFLLAYIKQCLMHLQQHIRQTACINCSAFLFFKKVYFFDNILSFKVNPICAMLLTFSNILSGFFCGSARNCFNSKGERN
jgi:hypothetical protein